MNVIDPKAPYSPIISRGIWYHCAFMGNGVALERCVIVRDKPISTPEDLDSIEAAICEKWRLGRAAVMSWQRYEPIGLAAVMDTDGEASEHDGHPDNVIALHMNSKRTTPADI